MLIMSYFDCIIIGAGVAGMTSAIYLKRYNKNVLLLEKSNPGGQITKTPKVENYPGYVCIDGATLAMNMFEQVTNLKINYQYGNVVKIEQTNNEKIVYTEKEEFHTKTIILATGRIPRKLGLDLENQLVGRGISWCATCDGFFYKNKEVAVVGGGNSALEEALFLSTMCEKVHILYRGEKMRADQMLQNKILEHANIEVHYFTEIIELKEQENQLNSIMIKEEEITKELFIKGLFIYIGFEPDTSLIKKMGVQLENNYVVVNSKMETNIKGIYACGDVIQKELYQLSTAVGEGSIAAYQVNNYIMNLEQ